MSKTEGAKLKLKIFVKWHKKGNERGTRNIVAFSTEKRFFNVTRNKFFKIPRHLYINDDSFTKTKFKEFLFLSLYKENFKYILLLYA